MLSGGVEKRPIAVSALCRAAHHDLEAEATGLQQRQGALDGVLDGSISRRAVLDVELPDLGAIVCAIAPLAVAV